MAFLVGGSQAIEYVESRQYTEPLFVFVIMVVGASRPVVEVIQALVAFIAWLAPVRTVVAQVWLCLALMTLIGSLAPACLAPSSQFHQIMVDATCLLYTSPSPRDGL